ncbi:galaxin-like [Crassostrea angulata]|uniref:galaxin-like n=1 Tax=Magallana angulata TaxID=2784310 RepID=UPI0022B0919B|nr:galaxin-like [Crassostrea angulata]
MLFDFIKTSFLHYVEENMKMKTITMGACCLPFLQCLLLGATNGCVFNDHSNEANPDGRKLCCGPSGSVESYFPRTQICCNGTVHDRKGRMCCNGEIYDQTQKICCEDTLHEKENRVCCGSKLHRVTTNQVKCCGGELHNNSQGCCGGQSLYNKSSQICCEFSGSFTIAAKENNFCCYDKAFDVRSQYCVNDQVLSLNNENLCGTEKYNISEKKCCDQTLYDMPQYLADCCESQLYDVNISKCCRGTKTVIANNRECCGEGK